jgi:hypothetical protein
MRRAFALRSRPRMWDAVRKTAMRQRFDWDPPAREYLRIYRQLAGLPAAVEVNRDASTLADKANNLRDIDDAAVVDTPLWPLPTPAKPSRTPVVVTPVVTANTPATRPGVTSRTTRELPGAVTVGLHA